MRLPKFAIENHQFAVILILLLTLMGVVSFLTMPKSEDPQISPVASSVIIVLPGANPTDLEELVVDPLEEVINELEDIKEISTKLEDGLAVIKVEFLTGNDPEDKYSDVVQKVNSIRNELPSEIVKLDVKKWTITDVKILQLGLVSDDASYKSLEKEAERLEKEFKKVSGIKDIDIVAFPEQEIRISLDLERIAEMHIPLNYVIGAVQSSNANIPGGSIDIGSKKFNIQTSGSYESIEEIKNTVVTAFGGKVVYIKDIADVKYDYRDETHRARVNKQKAVYITATQKLGTNIYNVSDGLKAKLAEFEKDLPENMKVKMVFDQIESVSFRLNGFFINLLQGLLLVGIVVIVAVGFKASIIVLIAIPFSILIGIGFLDLNHFGIEQMSIAGLVIALGLLVDNAIVVTENISRYMKLGLKPIEAAIKGTTEIGWAVVSSTVTTVLAFVPMMLMQNITGDFIRSMPLTVVFTLGASLLIALTLTPYLSSKFIKVEKKEKESWFQKTLSNFIQTKYRKLLKASLNRPTLIIVSAIVIFIFSLALFPLVGLTFFPKAEKPQFLINVETPEGTSLDRTDEVVTYVENILSKREEVKKYAINVGKGNPRIYYNQIQQNEKSNYGQIFVELTENDLDLQTNTVTVLRNIFKDYAGAKIEVKEFEQGPPVDAPIAIRIIGEELDELKIISLDVEAMFNKISGVINIKNPLSTSKTDLHVNINREKASILGVQIFEIDKTIRAAINGLTISKFRDATGKEYEIVLRLPINEKPELKDFDKIYVTSITGEQIPLKQLASIELKSSPMEIDHYNLERNVIITADVNNTRTVNEASKEILEKLNSYDWPNNYRYYAAGELERQEESFGGMFKAIIIAIVGIFGVLVLQFKSYSQPLIVFSAIPLAIIGSIIMLLVTGYSFSFTAFVGLTSLVGIVINNSIILVDYTNQLILEGVNKLEAIIIAGETRFTPIILTTATTIGGLLPLTLTGGTMWAPMGWTIIGGLLFSTVLTLLLVPVLYKVFTK